MYINKYLLHLFIVSRIIYFPQAPTILIKKSGYQYYLELNCAQLNFTQSKRQIDKRDRQTKKVYIEKGYTDK